MAIPRFTSVEKSIGDGPISPKCFLGHIRALYRVDKGSNFEVGLWSRWVAIPRLTLGEKSIDDDPRSPKCFLNQIRAQ